MIQFTDVLFFMETTDLSRLEGLIHEGERILRERRGSAAQESRPPEDMEGSTGCY